MKCLIFRSATFVILFTIAGCETGRVVYSEPFMSGKEVTKIKGDIFALPGMNLMAIPRNYELKEGFLWYIVPLVPLPAPAATHKPDSFTFTLIFDPEGEEFSLDLRSVLFEMNGKRYTPYSFKGPVGRIYYQGGGWRCDLAQDSVAEPVEHHFKKPLSLTEWSCFTVNFVAREPNPDEEFVLRIDGVFRNNKPYPVPPIHFRKGEKWITNRVL